MFNEYTASLDADSFLTKRLNYITRFKELLKEIYKNYKQLFKDKIKVPKDENGIRDILVDKYLSKNIDGYKFEKEKYNNLGRVDIFIETTFTDEKPEFIIECKILDNDNLEGTTGKNSEYIKNGIQRFLTEYYFSYNDFYVNAMIGFVTEKIDIVKNINSINNLSKKLLNNLVDITQQITLVDTNIYQSQYLTCNKKEFIVYHQMMNFSDNLVEEII
ncbi:MAG: hypothetical protein DRG78_13840 [Epsilonproteobacteria bacterium]|nr:MAG: hypothetical protein DRG78_13840 [Campylobacterota bacterium]